MREWKVNFIMVPKEVPVDDFVGHFDGSIEGTVWIQADNLVTALLKATRIMSRMFPDESDWQIAVAHDNKWHRCYSDGTYEESMRD